MEPTPFAKYTLLEHLGKGAVGSVYRARDSGDGSIVAVKIFESGEEREPEMARKLRDREVRMLVNVQHPNVVRFLGSGEEGDSFHYAMELVEESLLRCMRGEEDFELVDKIHILRQTTSALVAIHHQGVVHRDIKPGNILLDRDANGAIHVKLTDLGIAKNVSETDIVREQIPSRIPGTPKYLSPEQIRMLPVDGRTDVFSLGVVAYELIIGSPPFHAESSQGYLAANVEQQQVPAREAVEFVPDFLDAMIEKMLAKDREERYDSDALLRDLELAQQHLVSGAPLVERTNPGSLFYEPPASEMRRGEEPGFIRSIAPLSWGLSAVIVIAGALALLMLWPPAASGALAQPGPPQAQTSLAAERLQEATAAMDAGRYWQALWLLRAAQAEDAPAELRDRTQEALRRVQDTLAEDAYAAAMRMLQQNRRHEARIALLRMAEFLPDAERTRQLRDALRERERAESLDERWDAAVRKSYTLVTERRHREALTVHAGLLEEFADDPARVQSARRMIGDLLENWTRYLLQMPPDPDSIRELLDAVEAHRATIPDRPPASLMARVHLKLAQAYADRHQYALSIQQYEAAALAGDEEVASQAREAMEQLRERMTERPQEAEAIAPVLERDGFGGDLWRERTDPGGSQTVADGALQFKAEGGARETVLTREFAQPVRTLGFSTAAKLKVSPSILAEPGQVRCGIGVRDAGGNAFELYFDGASYLVARRSGQISAGGGVRKAFGDEDTAWHELGLRYNYETAQLAALIDGEAVQRYDLTLSEVRFHAFLVTPAGVAAAAGFKEPSFRP